MKNLVLKFATVVMVLTVVLLFPVQIKAAEPGTLPSNAIELTDGEWHTKLWTSTNYRLNCYNKIEIPSRGYITFFASKPTDDEGEIGSYDLILYNPDNTIAWAADTKAQADMFSEYYTYKIGLNAGTYYMNIDPSFYIFSNSAPIETMYAYTFTSASNWEVESNNNQEDATEISLDKTYYGVFRDESYDTSYKDYYKVKLTKGRSYKLTVGNYNELDAGTAIIQFCSPSGENIMKYNSVDNGNARTWEVTASTTGWFYLVIYNDANDAGTEYTVKVSTVKIPASKITAKFNVAKCTYNGKVRTPSVIATYNGKKLVKGTDYTVTYASGRKNVGKYNITVKFKGGYTGSKTLSLTINPKPTSITKKPIAASKAFRIYWSKISTQAPGYEIMYATNSSFTKNKKTVRISNYKTTTTKITGLKSKTKYYIKIRTYKTVKGVKYYSNWSKVQTVVTK